MKRDGVPVNGTALAEVRPSAGTLERGLAILELLATAGEASAAEVAGRLGLSRSATYRLLATLEQRGYLERAGPNRLRLGTRTAGLGMAAVAGIDLVTIAPPHLHDLAERTGETAFLAVVDKQELVYLAKEAGPSAVQLSSRLGSRRPLHSTGLGKAYLSSLPDDQLRAVVSGLHLQPSTPNTITDPDALLAAVEAARERGYAVDEGEVEPGVACIAAPIRDHRGVAGAAISVAGPADRVLARERTSGPLVMRTAAAISRRLGHWTGAVRPGEGDA